MSFGGRLDTVGDDAVLSEIRSQPERWAWTAAVAEAHRSRFARTGERVAAVGCGTSWYVAMAYAALREALGEGETDAFSPSTMPPGRAYDRVVVISRSGTTSELANVLRAAPRSLLITTVADSPLGALASEVIVLDAAAERAVVQTRSATTALMVLRRSVGDPAAVHAVDDARSAVDAPLPTPAVPVHQLVFLAAGWGYGIACEAALKCREAAAVWAEAYPVNEYRHGPIAAAGPGSLIWSFGPLPDDLVSAITGRGATIEIGRFDPLAELIRVQRFARDLARAAGRDPDRPDGLSFSVILDET